MMEESDTHLTKLEIPPSVLARMIKGKYKDEILTSQNFKIEYAKCIKTFVHFLSTL